MQISSKSIAQELSNDVSFVIFRHKTWDLEGGSNWPPHHILGFKYPSRDRVKISKQNQYWCSYVMIGDHTNKKTEIYRLYVIYSISYIFHLPSPYFLLSSSYKKGVSSFLPFFSCQAPTSHKEGSFILLPFFLLSSSYISYSAFISY